MSRIAFIVGCAMIVYDWSGHFVAWNARQYQWLADLWNAYAIYIWPSIPDNQTYDGWWSSWFAVATALLIMGYITKQCRS